MEWISVEDRLPEEHQDVLIFWKGKIDVAFLINYNLGFWRSPRDEDEESPFPVSASHWMELPKPPKESE